MAGCQDCNYCACLPHIEAMMDPMVACPGHTLDVQGSVALRTKDSDHGCCIPLGEAQQSDKECMKDDVRAVAKRLRDLAVAETERARPERVGAVPETWKSQPERAWLHKGEKGPDLSQPPKSFEEQQARERQFFHFLHRASHTQQDRVDYGWPPRSDGKSHC